MSERAAPRRTRWRSLLPCLALAAACTATPGVERTASPGGASPAAGPGGRFARIACGLPAAHLERLRNGYMAERASEIQFVLRSPHFFGGYSHSGPWGYLQRVPLLFYGPGHVPPVGAVGRPVTLTSVAPTLALHLGYHFGTPDGQALEEAVLPGAEPPRLVVVVVWDAAGRNVLERYPAEWGPVRRLIPRGAWFENATVGTSPSMTPPVHSTIGTGVYPRRHGIIDFRIRDGDRLVGAVRSGPRYLLSPTLADRDAGNRPLVGFVGWEPTLGMIGHGSAMEGGDEDLALALRHGRWGLSPANRGAYRFEEYVNEIPGLDDEARRLDVEDGRLDGRWLGASVLGTPADIEYTPAFSRYQTGVLSEVIRREGFGEDEVPDLLFTNYKQVDRVAHAWSFPTPQMQAVVAGVAEELAELIRLLDREVGRGRWVMALTADHGATPLASETGAFTVNRDELAADIASALDTDGDRARVVRNFLITQLWINVPELEENGHTLEDLADFLMEYTAADNAADPSALPEDLRDQRLFRAAFPGGVLDALPCIPHEA